MTRTQAANLEMLGYQIGYLSGKTALQTLSILQTIAKDYKHTQTVGDGQTFTKQNLTHICEALNACKNMKTKSPEYRMFDALHVEFKAMERCYT